MSLGKAEASVAVRLSQQGWAWVDGEKVTGGGNVFSNQSMDVEAAIEPMIRLSAQLGRR